MTGLFLWCRLLVVGQLSERVLDELSRFVSQAFL